VGMSEEINVKDMIVKYPDPILVTPTVPFNFLEPQVDAKELSQVLMYVMNHFNGIGLSANQIGKNLSVMCMKSSPENLVCFNPKIVYYSDEQDVMEEGCLSVPGVTLKVKRSKEIRVRFQTPSGVLETATFNGLTARVFQHEYDHLNGIIFINKVNRYHRDKAMKGYYK
jgi:peptide deformylase